MIKKGYVGYLIIIWHDALSAENNSSFQKVVTSSFYEYIATETYILLIKMPLIKCNHFLPSQDLKDSDATVAGTGAFLALEITSTEIWLYILFQ